MQNPTERFSDRVADYQKYRPSYPEEAVRDLTTVCGLTLDAVIADIGSGTGKLSELFLRRGYAVIGVEPNREMREAAEALLRLASRFSSVSGSAENTTLPDNSVDLLVAGQAYHWFEPVDARREFERVLKDDGKIALIWNQRKTELPFHSEYEELLRDHCPEYDQSNHRRISLAEIQKFSAPRNVRNYKYDYCQKFDLTGFLGRMFSSSYTPAEDSAQRQALAIAATKLFGKHALNGVLDFQYETNVYLII